MKKILCLVAALVAALSATAQTVTLTGKVTNNQGTAIEYATIFLTPQGEVYRPDGTNHHGAIASQEGIFTFEVPAGDYTLEISFLGYQTKRVDITIDNTTPTLTITLEESPEVIEEITLKGDMIVREADRFVMKNLSESPLAKGRDSYDMLKLAPGVWADNNGSISINGKSGVKIIINEREVRMTGDQLMAYLKAIPAENLQKIEILPQSGADYDANSSSGVIKITLRRLRESGTSGSVTLGGGISTTTPSHTIDPNININHKSGRWNTYASLSLSQYRFSIGANVPMQETTEYDNGATLTSTSSLVSSNIHGGGMVGAIYELSERGSLGVEYNIWHSPDSPSHTTSTLHYTLGGDSELHESYYEQRQARTNQSVTANYIHKLDNDATTLKIIGDWAGTTTTGVNINNNRMVHTVGGTALPAIDSLYTNNSLANYSYYTLTAAMEHKLSDISTLSVGAKYTLTDTYSATDYAYKRGDEWLSLGEYNQLTDYNEHIGALYGIFSTLFSSGASLSTGLRAEYTSIPVLNQEYVSLFPHINYSQPLTPSQSVILSASYKRGIHRPSFWQMNPVRNQLSEYSYQVGNPDLKPVYSNELALTTILSQRYSLTLGAYLQDGIISQLSMVDEADPTGRTLKYIHSNLNNLYQYYIQLSVPAQLTPWWTLNANVLGVMLDQRITSEDSNNRTFTAQGFMTNTFTLTKGWSLDLTGYFMSDAQIGNLTQKGNGNISLAVRKQCLDNKVTISLGVNNLFDAPQLVISSGEGFSRSHIEPNFWTRSINLSIRYNFQAGKMFRAKSVESGAAEEKGRMSSN